MKIFIFIHFFLYLHELFIKFWFCARHSGSIGHKYVYKGVVFSALREFTVCQESQNK